MEHGFMVSVALPDGRASDTAVNEMRESQKSVRQKWLTAFALLCFALAAPTPAEAEKIKPEEIVARHLESLGPAKARVSPRVIAGTSQVIFRTPPPGQAIGRA